MANKANAFGPFKEGKYLEKHQWGVLEDLINDWQTHKITTDECALLGCYALAAQEPTRTDKDQKAKLLPTKYKLGKKSKEAGPYFFIYFLYKFKDNLNDKVLNEFRNSDWCDEIFINEIISNKDLDKSIEKLQLIPEKKLMINKYDLYDVLINIAENKIISFDSIYVISMIQFLENNRFHKTIKEFGKRNNLKSLSMHFALIAQLCHKCREFPHNRLTINIFNFYYKYWDFLKVNLYGSR